MNSGLIETHAEKLRWEKIALAKIPRQIPWTGITWDMIGYAKVSCKHAHKSLNQISERAICQGSLIIHEDRQCNEKQRIEGERQAFLENTLPSALSLKSAFTMQVATSSLLIAPHTSGFAVRTPSPVPGSFFKPPGLTMV